MRKLLFFSVLLLLAGYTFGQTLKSGGVVMIHEYKHSLENDDLKSFMKDYEDKVMSLALEQFPEMKHMGWVKGFGTDNKGDLAIFVYYESLEDLRKYLNEDGTPTDKGSAAYGAIMPAFQELMEKYGEMKIVYRDWLIIP